MFVTKNVDGRLITIQGSISAKDYPLETNNVTTSDGYILGLQRIPRGVNSSDCATTSRKVVFLMHGVTFGSNSFTYAGPKYAMAYNLADAGSDVWMGNARGNSFSRRHVSLDPDKDSKQFFNSTYEDIAHYDLPAMFDYVLQTTGQDKLYYIGYSQGGTVFYVLNSMSSAYHSKIAAAHLLAGIGYQDTFPNTDIKLVSQSADVLYKTALRAGVVELAPSNFTLAAVETLVGTRPPTEFIVGASLKQLIHYLQNMRDESFRRWEYGAAAPRYELANVHVDVTVHYSRGDVTQSAADAALAVPRHDFNHIDYLTSDDARRLITDYIIESITCS